MTYFDSFKYVLIPLAITTIASYLLVTFFPLQDPNAFNWQVVVPFAIFGSWVMTRIITSC